MIKAREYLYELIEDVTGARLTISYTLSAASRRSAEGFAVKARKAIKDCATCSLMRQLLTKNKIFVDRMKDIGVISKEDALAYGITGPFLRSTVLISM